MSVHRRQTLKYQEDTANVVQRHQAGRPYMSGVDFAVGHRWLLR
jgi:hypothetical protein